MQAETKDMITLLLQQSALDRLGTWSSLEVKKHHYLAGINWGNLLQMKADFIPSLTTSFFDTSILCSS